MQIKLFNVGFFQVCQGFSNLMEIQRQLSVIYTVTVVSVVFQK